MTRRAALPLPRWAARTSACCNALRRTDARLLRKGEKGQSGAERRGGSIIGSGPCPARGRLFAGELAPPAKELTPCGLYVRKRASFGGNAKAMAAAWERTLLPDGCPKQEKGRGLLPLPQLFKQAGGRGSRLSSEEIAANPPCTPPDSIKAREGLGPLELFRFFSTD